MLELRILRDDLTRAKQGLRKRGFSELDLALLEQVIIVDDRRKSVQTMLDQMLSESKALANEIGKLYSSGRQSEAEEHKTKVSGLKSGIREKEQELRQVRDELSKLLLDIPNIPHSLVPAGSSASDNEIIKDWDGDMPELAASALPHWELAEKYGIFDLKIGVKLTGSGFPVFTGAGAILQRALVNFFLGEARKAGYTEISPPLLVNEDTARATGQLPDKEGQMYFVERDNLYLIPTSEVPVTNIYRDRIVTGEDLPIKLTAYSPCFRREAGSYGADVKGLNRVHQFDKVEIVQIAHPADSYKSLDDMCSHVSELLEKLELPYRIVRLCGGDLGFTSAMTYDFEVFSGAQEKWLEVSSVSNFETYQSNRLNLRIREANNQKLLAHTLNGSALALARILAALLENNQKDDGIYIPTCLQKFTGFEKIEIVK